MICDRVASLLVYVVRIGYQTQATLSMVSVSRLTLIVCPLLGVVLTAATCHAQMFGNRNLGSPLSRRSAAEVANSAGIIQGGERFIRGNRTVDDFVGIDALDRARFVGQVNAQNQLAIGEPAISELGNSQSRQINAPLRTRPANALHEPVLLLGFELGPESTARLVEQARTQIGHALTSRFGNQIEVSVEGRTAILRGAVGDANDARLAELMTSLEPGISAVQNELTWGEPPATDDSADR